MNPYGLVRLRDLCPDIVVDMRYSGADNFFGKALYDANEAWLLEGSAIKISHAVSSAAAKGFRIAVLDAYRPLSAQVRMWDILPDPDFVAPPSRGSVHNRGAAVDVTLADASGAELSMPSAYDDFSPRSSHGYSGGDPDALSRRRSLREIMEGAGFVSYEAEWWHYVDAERKGSPLIDIPLSRLPEDRR